VPENLVLLGKTIHDSYLAGALAACFGILFKINSERSYSIGQYLTSAAMAAIVAVGAWFWFDGDFVSQTGEVIYGKKIAASAAVSFMVTETIAGLLTAIKEEIPFVVREIATRMSTDRRSPTDRRR